MASVVNNNIAALGALKQRYNEQGWDSINKGVDGLMAGISERVNRGRLEEQNKKNEELYKNYKQDKWAQKNGFQNWRAWQEAKFNPEGTQKIDTNVESTGDWARRKQKEREEQGTAYVAPSESTEGSRIDRLLNDKPAGDPITEQVEQQIEQQKGTDFNEYITGAKQAGMSEDIPEEYAQLWLQAYEEALNG